MDWGVSLRVYCEPSEFLSIIPTFLEVVREAGAMLERARQLLICVRVVEDLAHVPPASVTTTEVEASQERAPSELGINPPFSTSSIAVAVP